MAKTLISNRVVFENKKSQGDFLFKVREKLDLPWLKIAEIINVDQRTLKDWSKCKFRISQKAILQLSKMSKIPIPKNVKIISWNKHLKNIAQEGGKANYLKNKLRFLQTTKRDRNWRKWWKYANKDKLKFLYKRKRVILPVKNVELAEFVGIMIGDGGISRYKISITLNSETDLVYSGFVRRLIKKLFNVPSKIYRRKNSLAMDVIVHRPGPRRT